MKFVAIFATIVALLVCVATALPGAFDSTANELLTPRSGCSGGVNVCCGSTSVGCSGNVCKACCGSTCGCFYVKGSSCSSNLPCTDVTKPDFPMTNGQCVAPAGGSGGGSGSTGSGTGSSGTNGKCARLPAAFRKFFGC